MPSRVRVRCGTSGFSYLAWRGSFYPPKARPAELLPLYAARLPAVEINATFYRSPSARVLAGWRAQVPPGFAFALKGPQRITHAKRLAGVEEEASRFHAAAAALGPALGPVLWQLPPSFRKDLARLEAFLALLPPGAPAAFELRHPSWRSDDVLAALARHGAALATSDDGEREAPVLPTAPWGYLRLRAPDYDAAGLRAWATRILSQPWGEAWVFFKHEDAGRGPALALALAAVLGEGAGAERTPWTGP
ncbi:DUF72 domain-containing protein [Anaeromyxobacter paludicola]|nr:DUF72 domain-containing protein [Anaeromyxobacter paludicola]